MKDQNVYRKLDNGRYQPYGVCYEPDNLSDGIWYVRHHKYSRAITSVPYIAGLFRVGDASEISVPVLCSLEDMCDKIMSSKEFNEIIKPGNGYTMQDIVHTCVKIIYNESLNNKDNEK